MKLYWVVSIFVRSASLGREFTPVAQGGTDWLAAAVKKTLFYQYTRFDNDFFPP